MNVAYAYEDATDPVVFSRAEQYEDAQHRPLHHLHKDQPHDKPPDMLSPAIQASPRPGFASAPGTEAVVPSVVPSALSNSAPESQTAALLRETEPTRTGRAPGHKPVSTTKRAAQNRNAQKAFRIRREKYVKDLEETAIQVVELQKTVEQLRQENHQLREYTMVLQSRLMELSPAEPGVSP